MPIKKSYAEHGDACTTAHAMELIGDVWTYPVLREMFLGPKRFTELAALLHGITPAVLTTRLRDLEAKGLVERVQFPPPAMSQGYALTPWGHALEEPLEGVARWAHASPTWRPDGGLTPDGAVLAMKAMGRRATHAGSEALRLQLHLSDRRCDRPDTYDYAVSLDASGLTAVRGVDTAPVAVTCDSTTWANVLFQTAALDSSTVAGDAVTLECFLDDYRTAVAGHVC